mgnify:CR=1 FL=1
MAFICRGRRWELNRSNADPGALAQRTNEEARSNGLVQSGTKHHIRLRHTIGAT